jgi:glycerol-3-phosphate acyltransferase PlsY
LGEVGLWVGMGAILGHVFTPFLQFKGGKGIATGAGVLCGAYPILFLLVLVSWMAMFMVTRIVSISSIASLIVLVMASILIQIKSSVIYCFIFIALFIVWTHRSNISRLIKGKENKLN